MDYLSWTIPEQTVSALETNLMILISAIFVLGFILIIRYEAKVVPGLVGALAFLLFGLIGSECICLIVGLIPGISNLVYSNAVGYSIFRALVLAAMYHVGRIVTIKLTTKEEYTIGDCMMAGYGNAFGFAIVSGVNYIYSSTLAKTINEYGMEALLEGNAQDEIESVVESLRMLVTAPSQLFTAIAFNDVIDIVALIILSVFLYGMYVERIPKYYHGIIIGVQALIRLPSVLIECYSMEHYVMLTIAKVVILFVTFWGMFYVDSRYLNKAFANAGSNGVRTVSRLPRMRKK